MSELSENEPKYDQEPSYPFTPNYDDFVAEQKKVDEFCQSQKDICKKLGNGQDESSKRARTLTVLKREIAEKFHLTEFTASNTNRLSALFEASKNKEAMEKSDVWNRIYRGNETIASWVSFYGVDILNCRLTDTLIDHTAKKVFVYFYDDSEMLYERKDRLEEEGHRVEVVDEPSYGLVHQEMLKRAIKEYAYKTQEGEIGEGETKER